MIEEKKLSVAFIYRDNMKIPLQGELPSCRCINHDWIECRLVTCLSFVLEWKRTKNIFLFVTNHLIRALRW